MGLDLAPRNTALQHGHAPRPLPLFLEMVREMQREDPAMARRALQGLDRYAHAHRSAISWEKPGIAAACGATLRDHGGTGPPLVLVPSLINPPHVLDLPGQSLAAALAAQHHVLLVDWGTASDRGALDLGGHIETLLVPLLRMLGESVALVGYCVGGTMEIGRAHV